MVFGIILLLFHCDFTDFTAFNLRHSKRSQDKLLKTEGNESL